MNGMKKIMLAIAVLFVYSGAVAQYFNEDIQWLYSEATKQNDSLQLLQIRKQVTGIDMQSARFNYLPKIGVTAGYTRLNDDIVFPGNLQQLLMGTQGLLIKEAAGIPFNNPLPSTIPLQPVSPIQEKNIFKTTLTGQWLLFGGTKIKNGLRAYEHQQKALDHLSQKEQTKLWLEVSEVYDQLALLHKSDAIINSTAELLEQQNKFVEGAIKNGLATILDRKKITLARQRLEYKKIENESNKKILLHKLHQLTGVDIKELGRMKPELVAAYFDVTIQPAERAEIKALHEGMEARKYKAKAELSEYIPKLVAFGQYELRDKDLSLLEPKWAAGIKLQWNLFDGLAARNNARKESMEIEALQVQERSARELLTLGYQKAKQDYQVNTQKLALKKKEIALTRETYDFVKKQYINGLTTMTELLSAMNDLEKAGFDYEQAVFDQRRAALKAADLSGTLLQ